MFSTSETLLDHEGKLHIYLFVLCIYKLHDKYLDLVIRYRKIKSSSLVYLPFTLLQCIFFCLRQKCHWEETLREGVGVLAPSSSLCFLAPARWVTLIYPCSLAWYCALLQALKLLTERPLSSGSWAKLFETMIQNTPSSLVNLLFQVSSTLKDG